MFVTITGEMNGEVYYLCEGLNVREVYGLGTNKFSSVRGIKRIEMLGIEVDEHKDIYKLL